MQILATDLTLLWLHCTQLLDPSTPHSTLTPRPFHAAPSNSSSSFLKLPRPPRLFSFIIESIYDWNWLPSPFLLWLLILIPNPWLLLTSSFIWCLLLWHRNTAWKISFSIHLLHALPPSELPKPGSKLVFSSSCLLGDTLPHQTHSVSHLLLKL